MERSLCQRFPVSNLNGKTSAILWVIALTGCLSAGPPTQGQSYASVAGTYSRTEDSVQTLTYGGESETLTDSYEISNLVIRQNGAVFTYSAQPPGGGSSSYTRTGTLNGNRIVALTGPVVIEVSPEIRVTRNEITSVEGTVSDGKIVIRMTGIAEGMTAKREPQAGVAFGLRASPSTDSKTTEKAS